MVSARPHFLLFSESHGAHSEDGRWRFLLESTDGETVVEASDVESDLHGERLELLAVVRGLEALDQPSRVTLVTASTRISRGFRFGLDEWRLNQWRWERDGRWVPIKNGDLWRRVDHALKFHEVRCRTLRTEAGIRKSEITSGPTVQPVRRAVRPLRNRLGAALRAFFAADGVPETAALGHLSN